MVTAPMKDHSFASLELKAELLSNLESLEFNSMTAIQAQALPLILAGRDVVAQGQTGSGKTAAFGLGILNKLDNKAFRVQSLVLCPTRELAEQVSVEIRRFARSIPNVKVLTLYGGTPIKPQMESLQKGVHIVVGTPGRIDDHLQKGSLDLSHISSLVLDEADRMLDMGFQKTLESIVEKVPSSRQTLLFSATYPPEIKQIVEQITQNAEFAKVAPSQDKVRIDERFYQVDNEAHRLEALMLLLLQVGAEQSVVFCNTRAETQSVAGKLKSKGFSAASLHGDMEQKDRDQTLIRFSNKSISVLVATDVAARGLDIDSLDHVFNYHLPREVIVYTHRIGRTGRAGQKGSSYSLYQASEQFRLEQLEKYLERRLDSVELPPIELLEQAPGRPQTSTLRVEGGKKQKLRAGDLVGALTKGEGISATQIGKIQVMENWAYIAVDRDVSRVALQKLSGDKIKGKSFRARLI
jgi:ATP-independent RNA helicase DbpA